MLTTVATANITLGGTPADAKSLHFKVSRVVGDANDTATEDARLHSVAIRFTIDAATSA